MELLKEYGTANIAVEGYSVAMMDEFLRKLDLHNLAHTSTVVLMIGAEDVSRQLKSEEIFEKIVIFVETIRQRFDHGTKLIILSILPRDSPGLNRVINTVNTRLNNKYKAYGVVKFIDLTSKFYNAAVGMLESALYSTNNYHINTAGYTTIIEAILPLLGDVPKLDVSSTNVATSSVCDLSILDTFAILPSRNTEQKTQLQAASDMNASPETNSAMNPKTVLSVDPNQPTAPPSGGILSLTDRSNPDRPDGTSVTPALHKRHAEFEPEILANLATYNDKTKVILFGDSVFYKFGNSNLMPEYNPINMASASFQTEHVLMRVSNANLLPMRKVPVVALMVGGFNVGSKDSPNAVFKGILAVVNELKIKFSRHTKILVLSILPRDSLKLNKDIREINNALIAASDMSDSGFTFVDLTNRFLDSQLTLEKKMFEADKFTLSDEGLKLLKDILVSVIDEAVVEHAAVEAAVTTTTSSPHTQTVVRNSTDGSDVSKEIESSISPVPLSSGDLTLNSGTEEGTEVESLGISSSGNDLSERPEQNEDDNKNQVPDSSSGSVSETTEVVEKLKQSSLTDGVQASTIKATTERSGKASPQKITNRHTTIEYLQTFYSLFSSSVTETKYPSSDKHKDVWTKEETKFKDFVYFWDLLFSALRIMYR